MFMVLSFTAAPALGWETPLVIAGGDGANYYKPEIGFDAYGGVYITYRKKGAASNSDIILCYYDGKTMTYENVSESSQFWASYKSYESDIEITADGRVHVAWVAHNRATPDTHHIKYRYKDGNTWSDIIEMGEFHLHSGDVFFDLRLGVSNNGNVHIIAQEEHQVVIKYVAMYDGVVMPAQAIGNPGSRLKHPDIAVNDDWVHAIWMRKVGFPYVIMYQKWENKPNGANTAIRQVTFPVGEYASQKSRIDLDSMGYFHMAEFYKKGVVKKLKYWQELSDGTFAPYVNLSHQQKLMLYHWAGLEVRDNSIIASFQLGSSSGGSGIHYNWKQNGVWGGYSSIPQTDGAVHQSVDLNADGTVAAIAYGRFTSSIQMVSSEPIIASGALEADFTKPGMIFWGSETTFDASAVAGLNPDYNIALYTWDFGDGNVTTTTNPSVTHTYNGSYDVDFNVKLEVTAETGETGVAEQTVHVWALYNAFVTGVDEKRIRTFFFNRSANMVSFSPNAKNQAAGFPAIAKYEIWRAPQSSVITDNNYVYVGEAGANQNFFLDFYGVQEGVNYVYVIRSVDGNGNKSPFNNY